MGRRHGVTLAELHIVIWERLLRSTTGGSSGPLATSASRDATEGPSFSPRVGLDGVVDSLLFVQRVRCPAISEMPPGFQSISEGGQGNHECERLAVQRHSTVARMPDRGALVLRIDD